MKQYGRNKSPVIYNCLEKVRVVGKLQNHFWCFAVFGLMLRFFFTCSFSPSLISLSLSLLMIVKKLWMASAFCLHLPITSQLLSSLTLSLYHILLPLSLISSPSPRVFLFSANKLLLHILSLIESMIL